MRNPNSSVRNSRTKGGVVSSAMESLISPAGEEKVNILLPSVPFLIARLVNYVGSALLGPFRLDYTTSFSGGAVVGLGLVVSF